MIKFNHRFLFLWILAAGFGIILGMPEVGLAEGGVYNSHGRRDPFMQLVTKSSRQASGLLAVETPNDLVVEGIAYDQKKGSVVIVNGSVMREGEEVGAVKVIQIRPDGAVFSVNGMEEFKTMYQ